MESSGGEDEADMDCRQQMEPSTASPPGGADAKPPHQHPIQLPLDVTHFPPLLHELLGNRDSKSAPISVHVPQPAKQVLCQVENPPSPLRTTCSASLRTQIHPRSSESSSHRLLRRTSLHLNYYPTLPPSCHQPQLVNNHISGTSGRQPVQAMRFYLDDDEEEGYALRRAALSNLSDYDREGAMTQAEVEKIRNKQKETSSLWSWIQFLKRYGNV